MSALKSQADLFVGVNYLDKDAERLNKLIEKMFKLPRLDAVCLCINSHGGSPVQSELRCNRIISLAKELHGMVYSWVEVVAASGGYWLACSGKKKFATNS